jgi:hypothetical protein
MKSVIVRQASVGNHNVRRKFCKTVQSISGRPRSADACAIHFKTVLNEFERVCMTNNANEPDVL